MSLPIHRFKHLKDIWDKIEGVSIKSKNPIGKFNLDKPAHVDVISDPYLLKVLNESIYRQEQYKKDLETICDGYVVPTEPKYIKFLISKKRHEVLEIAKASADSQQLNEFTLSHLLCASSLKEPEFSVLILKSGLGAESVAYKLGVPLVISKPKKEVKPDEICKWIIDHSEEREISIFESICHFIGDALNIEKYGVEPGLIIDSIRNPYEENSILWIDSLPNHMKN